MNIVLENMNEELYWTLTSIIAKSLGEIDFDVNNPATQQELLRIKNELKRFQSTKLDKDGIFKE